MSRAVEVTGGTHAERVALHSGWVRVLAICWVGGFSFTSLLGLVVNFRQMVVQGEWLLMLYSLGVFCLTFFALAKLVELATVHVTRDGLEVRGFRSERTASWDEVAQVRFTEFVRRTWITPLRWTVVIGRIRFVDGRNTTFVANLLARESWNFMAPEALTLTRKCIANYLLFTVWRSSARRRKRRR